VEDMVNRAFERIDNAMVAGLCEQIVYSMGWYKEKGWKEQCSRTVPVEEQKR